MHTTPNATAVEDDGRLDRSDAVLADAIRRALEHGHMPLALRLFHTAGRLPRRSDELIEQLARVQHAAGEIDAALAIIDTITTRNGPQVTFRAALLLALDRRTEAHAELLRGNRFNMLDDNARLLLALLESEAGNPRDARDLLAKVESNDVSAHVVRAALAAACADRVDPAAAVHALQECSTFPHERERAQVALSSISSHAAYAGSIPLPSRQLITTLADDLRAAPAILPTLMLAQRISFDIASARLLFLAIVQWVESIDKCETAAEQYAALVELGDRLHGTVVAEAWLTRGLARHPRSTMLLQMRAHMDAGASPARNAPAVHPEIARHGVLATIGPDTSGAHIEQEAA